MLADVVRCRLCLQAEGVDAHRGRREHGSEREVSGGMVVDEVTVAMVMVVVVLTM